MKAAFLLLGSLVLFCDPLRGQSIPVTDARSLADNVIKLPDDLKGKPAVLVLGFSKSSSRQTKPWADELNRDFGSDPKIAFYQLPMLQEVPCPLRGFVLQGMRKPLSTADRKHFVPVFDNEAAWKVAAHFVAPDEAYVLLVDGFGRIEWQASGVFGDEKYEALRKRAITLEQSVAPHN